MTKRKEAFMKKIFAFNELYHHGILGMKWGVRRYQNPDGTLTVLGRKRRRKKTVFISGSSKTTTPESPYYREEIPEPVRKEINRLIKRGDKIIVGDAPGIDSQVQDYLYSQNYSNVEVYGPGTKVRYLSNSKWKTHPVDAPQYEVGSSEWLAEKDIVMSKVANAGLAVTLDEGSRATKKNVQRLLDANKDVKVYELNKLGKDHDRWAT